MVINQRIASWLRCRKRRVPRKRQELRGRQKNLKYTYRLRDGIPDIRRILSKQAATVFISFMALCVRLEVLLFLSPIETLILDKF